jgi:hypothetical protein
MGCAVVLTLASLVGCQPSAPTHALHDVNYYRTHLLERQARVTECSNDLSAARANPDCPNATRAEELESIGTLRALPPQNLPAPSRQNSGFPAGGQ